MTTHKPTFQELQDELIALFGSTTKYDDETSCVAACMDEAATCVQGCPPNDTIEGKKCVIACGLAGRKCIKECGGPPIALLDEADALLQEMSELVALEEAEAIEAPDGFEESLYELVDSLEGRKDPISDGELELASPDATGEGVKAALCTRQLFYLGPVPNHPGWKAFTHLSGIFCTKPFGLHDREIIRMDSLGDTRCLSGNYIRPRVRVHLRTQDACKRRGPGVPPIHTDPS